SGKSRKLTKTVKFCYGLMMMHCAYYKKTTLVRKGKRLNLRLFYKIIAMLDLVLEPEAILL
ncbi:hypothetical protein MXB_1304, partial [Myxobolus squamalis]